MNNRKISAIFALVAVLMLSVPVSAAWWDSSWDYRKNITVTETSGQDLSNHQIKLELNTSEMISSGNMRASCQDLRFAGNNDTSMDYWIESGCNTESTTVWVELPELKAGAEKTIYAYYGNPEASPGSNGKATFPVFDGFNDGTLSDQWTDYNSGDALTESNGRLEITTGNVHSATEEVSQPGTVVEARLKYTSSISGDHSGLMIADSGTMSGSNSNGNANVLFITDETSGQVSTWTGNGDTTSYNICSGVSTFTATTGENYIYSITDTGSQVQTALNYDNRVSCTGDLTSQHSNFVIGLGHFSLDSDPTTTDTSYDWVRTRNYVASKPQIEIGSEASVDICDARGPVNECIINSSRDISGEDFTFNSIFIARESADISSTEASGAINVDNRSTISGLWRGSINLSSRELVLTSGAYFRPEDGRISLNVVE
ncbi:DUF2341 domain-containing protein [Candidatus Nanosalina sp. VS9-1]|uniref:DUF2341 domain-containing protein n=1 Tax=Candidatus Nanosalina sp. VS9-1 TaxID=3388566 RepID=UPI0039E19170